MEDILDQPLVRQDKLQVQYGGFGRRFAASLLDGIILAPLTFGFTYFNINSSKSILLMVIVNLVALGYKPLLEFIYGATWGKMAMKLSVRNLEFEKPSLGQILLRNVFHLGASLITLFFTIVMYSDSDFESVSGFNELMTFTQQFEVLRFINYANLVLTVIDAIVLIADKQDRSLHDRIGGTVVIYQP